MIKKRTTLTIVLLPFLLSSCLVGRFAWYNFSGITDYKIFPARALVKSDKPFLFTDAVKTDRIGKVSVQKLDSVSWLRKFKHFSKVITLFITKF